MKRYNLFTVLYLLILICPVVSSAASNIDRTPLVDRKPRISTLGFSFIPPPGINWLEEFGDNLIKYLKKIDPAAGTLFGVATEFHMRQTFPTPDIFKEYITTKRIPKETQTRYVNTKMIYSLEPSIAPFCVRYQEQYEDWGAKNLYGRSFLIVINHGLACLHPENQNFLVDIYFSYRYPPDNRDNGLISEGEEFVNSLKMIPLKANAESNSKQAKSNQHNEDSKEIGPKIGGLKMPVFLPDYFSPAFKINGRMLTLTKDSVKDGVEQYLY